MENMCYESNPILKSVNTEFNIINLNISLCRCSKYIALCVETFNDSNIWHASFSVLV